MIRPETPTNAGFSKIAFALPPDEGEWEHLWAAPLDEKLVYRVDSIPLHVFGLASDDVVRARSENGHLTFDSVLRRGGHSTYRIAPVPTASHQRLHDLLGRLQRLGCEMERSASGRLIAIDVPPTTDIYAVYAVLQEGLDDGTWWFDEMHVGHKLRES